jgi:hypothetical protein
VSRTARTSESNANVTRRCRQRSYSAVARPRMPPSTYQLPKVWCRYGSTTAAAGAVRGSKP